MVNPTKALIDEIDEFFAAEKLLFESAPKWVLSEYAPKGNRERKAIWPICDDLQIAGKAQFRFAARAGGNKNFSISIIYDQLLIARLDIEEIDTLKPNPHWAFELDLPPMIKGSHIHKWQDNKDYIFRHGFGKLPCRRPLPPQIRTFNQAFTHIAQYANVSMTSEGRNFDLPWAML